MDTLIAGAAVVTGSTVGRAELVLEGGCIAAILPPDAPLPETCERIDAGGLLVLPGAIDVHMHFTDSNDHPTEELREGTRGAALGGITTILEMPHSVPPATTPAGFEHKRAMAAAESTVDFGLANRKGEIRAGHDADLAFYDPSESWTVRGAQFRGMGRWSALEGMPCRGRVVRTMVRGITVYRDGDFPMAPGFGRFLTRQRTAA